MTPRREVLVVLAFGALLPRAARAQAKAKVWRIGILSQITRPTNSDLYRQFVRGMRDLGYVEGKNLQIEWRSSEGQSSRLPALATELVQLNVDVLVAAGSPPTQAAQKATTVIPIVMAGVGDPVELGFIKSLARPGGNTTGVANITGELGPKRLEMLLSVVPKVKRVAYLFDDSNAVNALGLKYAEAAAQKLGVTILSVGLPASQQFGNAFEAMTRQKAQALIVSQAALLRQHASQITEHAVKRRLPSIGTDSHYSEAGGLMSYGQNNLDNYWRAANYVDKIFKGVKPRDLPVEQPMTFEIAINMKTAKALGLTFPPSVMVRATKVIE